MGTVTLVDTLPTTRKDGASLAASEIASITFQKASLEGSPPVLGDPVILETRTGQNGQPLQDADLTFVDSGAQPGDAYTSYVTDTDGHIGDPSTAFTVPATKAAPSAPSQSGTFAP